MIIDFAIAVACLISCDAPVVISSKISSSATRPPRGYGEKIAGTIDEEVKRIIEECYAQARSIIQEYHPVLEKCAELLLEKEKITRSEFEALFEESETDA